MSQIETARTEQTKGCSFNDLRECEHILHFYESDRALLQCIGRFALEGLLAGDGVIVIATHKHQKALDIHLLGCGVDVAATRTSGQFITPNAEETLSSFMRDGWPDKRRFEKVVGALLARARQGRKRVRAFGEMVALLWARGQSGATVQLEHYWHTLCREERFPLLCAYPHGAFDNEDRRALRSIRLAHSRVLPE